MAARIRRLLLPIPHHLNGTVLIFSVYTSHLLYSATLDEDTLGSLGMLRAEPPPHSLPPKRKHPRFNAPSEDALAPVSSSHMASFSVDTNGMMNLGR